MGSCLDIVGGKTSGDNMLFVRFPKKMKKSCNHPRSLRIAALLQNCVQKPFWKALKFDLETGGNMGSIGWKTKDLSKQCLVAKHIYCDFRWCFGVATWPKMEDLRSRKHAWCRNVASLQSGPFYCLKIPVKTWPQPNQQNRFLKARSRKMQQT